LMAGVAYAVWALRTVEIREQIRKVEIKGHPRTVEIRGRVGLQGWDGTITAPGEARALLFVQSEARQTLREQLASWPDREATAEAWREEARIGWHKRVEAREAALKILRVAEQANASDLAACRTRYKEAELAATAAFAELEERTESADIWSDPATVVAEWRGALDGCEVGEDGSFILRAQADQRPVVVVLAGMKGGSGARQAWLKELSAVDERVEVDFSNNNVLTWARLREFAELREELDDGEQ
jgi:hypothetical protein